MANSRVPSLPVKTASALAQLGDGGRVLFRHAVEHQARVAGRTSVPAVS